MTRQNIQASINLSDPFEKELYEYALKQGKMSSYIKRLIYLDKLSKVGLHQPQPQIQQPTFIAKEEDVYEQAKKKRAMSDIPT